ncbi:MAG: M1 family aminopeptidase [Anaeromyxobacter sp.]
MALPTALLISAAFFALATGTRSMTATYVGAVAFLAAYFVAVLLAARPEHERLVSLLDPFGIGPLQLATRYWTVAERNGQLPWSPLMLQNRLLWLGVAGALFALAYWRFRFEARPGRAARRSADWEADRERDGGAPAPGPAPAPAALGHRVTPRFGRATAWAQLLAVSRFEAVGVLRSAGFWVLLVLGLLNAFAALWTSTDLMGAELHPATRTMVNVLDGAFTLFPLIIAIYYAGELAWRDRERRVHELTGATPAPDWAFLLPRLAALMGILAATTLAGVVAAILVQLLKGWPHLELGHYLAWYVAPSLATLALVAALATFVQAVVPHKAVGWAVMLVHVVLMSALRGAGFEHVLYRYGSTTPTPISDMNGAGRFWIGAAWLTLYWAAFAVILLVVAHGLSRRGNDQALRPRLRGLRRRLAGSPAALAGGAALVWVGTGSWIFTNTNVLNAYVPSRAAEARLAEVEKQLSPYLGLPQPKVTDVTLDVQLFPRQVRVETRGRYDLENRTGAPLDRLHVRWNLRTELVSLELPGATLEQDFGPLHYRIYRLATPMAPGERRSVGFATRLQERGFPALDPLTRVVENGTFVDSFELGLQFGFWYGEETLKDCSKRRKYGLGDPPRWARLGDDRARAYHYLRRDSDWVNADLTVTTDADQLPVAPGYLLEDRTAGGRRTIHTRTDAPIHHFFSLQSARYAVRTEQVGAVTTSVLYHPDHPYNVDRMMLAMRRSLELFQQAYSPFQFRQLRILEFPAYATFAQSFANTIPFSESIGFVADGSDPEKVDLATYVTAHEVAHQWWAHQVIGAEEQGATLLSESFSQYSALRVMEDLYGKAQVRRFLKYELDRYLASRGTELLEELPLAQVEDQSYVYYQKGTLAMAWLAEVVGREPIDRALRRLIAQYGLKPAPYPTSADFLRLLREEAGPEHEQLIADLFERITLYDLQAVAAQVTPRPDGRFDVALTVRAAKKYADGKGVEAEAAMDELVEVGLFEAEPGKQGFDEGSVILLEKRRVHDGEQVLTAVVDRAPAFAGLDPFNERIDRNSDDNLVRPELTSAAAVEH